MTKSTAKQGTDQDMPKVSAVPDYERYVLGSLMIGNAESEEVFDMLAPEMFFLSPHVKIYRTLLDLREKHQPMSLPDVWERLVSSGDSNDVDVAYLASLMDGMPTIHSLQTYILAIRRTYRIRKYARFAQSLIAMLDSPSITEQVFLQTAAEGIAEITRDLELSADMGKTFNEAGVDLFCALDKDTAVRVDTGIGKVDEMIGGFKPGELVVLTADTGVGKTILAQQCRRVACSRGWHTLYCSAEMLAHHLVSREVAAEANIAQWKMRVPEKLYPEERLAILEIIGHLCKQCRVLDRELTLARIGTAARAMKRKQGLDLIVLDYDELIEVPGKDEWEQQKTLARAAKSLAMELDCVVVLISQLRKPLQGEDRAKPRIQSLYGSGAKAKHASIVIYVDREYVRELQGDETAATVFVLKSRDGRVGRVDCKFNVHKLRFDNLPTEQTDRGIYG